MNSASFDASESADLSTLFDVGGIVGGIIAGVLSDVTGMSAVTCAVMLVVAIPMVKQNVITFLENYFKRFNFFFFKIPRVALHLPNVWNDKSGVQYSPSHVCRLAGEWSLRPNHNGSLDRVGYTSVASGICTCPSHRYCHY